MVKDHVGRENIKWSREGPLTVEVYPACVMEATNVMQVRHITEMLQNSFLPEEIFNVITIVDDGSDWSVKGMLNFMSLGLFWMHMKLDHLSNPMLCPRSFQIHPD